ncbi:hypothetical protein RUND412_008186 [Rhizina undulata]
MYRKRARYAEGVDEEVTMRYERAISQRYLITQTRSVPSPLEAVFCTFEVLGSSVTTYIIRLQLGHAPFCSCPDFERRSEACKHIFFVVNNILADRTDRWTTIHAAGGIWDMALMEKLREHLMGRDKSEKDDAEKKIYEGAYNLDEGHALIEINGTAREEIEKELDQLIPFIDPAAVLRAATLVDPSLLEVIRAAAHPKLTNLNFAHISRAVRETIHQFDRLSFSKLYDKVGDIETELSSFVSEIVSKINPVIPRTARRSAFAALLDIATGCCEADELVRRELLNGWVLTEVVAAMTLLEDVAKEFRNEIVQLRNEIGDDIDRFQELDGILARIG